MSITKEAAWLRTGDVCGALGISRDTLRRRQKDGFLRPKIHYIRSGPSQNSVYVWNLSECKEVFGTWKAPRRGKK